MSRSGPAVPSPAAIDGCGRPRRRRRAPELARDAGTSAITNSRAATAFSRAVATRRSRWSRQTPTTASSPSTTQAASSRPLVTTGESIASSTRPYERKSGHEEPGEQPGPADVAEQDVRDREDDGREQERPGDRQERVRRAGLAGVLPVQQDDRPDADEQRDRTARPSSRPTVVRRVPVRATWSVTGVTAERPKPGDQRVRRRRCGRDDDLVGEAGRRRPARLAGRLERATSRSSASGETWSRSVGKSSAAGSIR